MSDFKYTKDGRKVAVLGQLNSQEFIVQEVFVTNGQEVPAGENFVAKGLLDQPAESWKEKRIREMDARYEKALANMEREFNQASARLRSQTEKAKARAFALFKFCENADSDQLTTLRLFLSGGITHFYIRSYQPKIVTWDDDDLYQKDGYHITRIEYTRLITLFGNSKGDLSYRIHQYSDGSGMESKEAIPCSSYDEALAHAQADMESEAEKFVAGERNGFSVDRWGKIDGIQIPRAALEKHRKNQESIRQQKIEKLRSELDDLERQS